MNALLIFHKLVHDTLSQAVFIELYFIPNRRESMCRRGLQAESTTGCGAVLRGDLE